MGPRGPGPPERPGGPRETSVLLRGFKGACKRPLKLQDDHPLFIDALLQFASVFCTEIAVEKYFDSLKCDFWRGLKKFSRLTIAHHILGPPHKLCRNSTTAHMCNICQSWVKTMGSGALDEIWISLPCKTTE